MKAKEFSKKVVAKTKQLIRKSCEIIKENYLPKTKLCSGKSDYIYIGKKEDAPFELWSNKTNNLKYGIVETCRFEVSYRAAYSYTFNNFKFHPDHNFSIFMIYSKKRNATYAWVIDEGIFSIKKYFGYGDSIGTLYKFTGLINHSDFYDFLSDNKEFKRLYWIKENATRTAVEA